MQNVSVSRGIKTDPAMLFMLGTVLFGTVLGCVAYCLMPQSFTELISETERSFFNARAQSEPYRVFLDTLAVSTLFIGAEFLLGFFAFGQLPELFILAVRGMGLGAVLSQVYGEYTGMTRLYAVVLIVPSAVISVYALASCARDAVRLSTHIMLTAFSDQRVEGSLERVRTFSKRFVLFEVLACASALTDCLCALLFASKIL